METWLRIRAEITRIRPSVINPIRFPASKQFNPDSILERDLEYLNVQTKIGFAFYPCWKPDPGPQSWKEAVKLSKLAVNLIIKL